MMKTRLVLGLLMLLPWSVTARAGDGTYDPNKCEAFEYNSAPAFTVPAGGTYRQTIDCRQCGGFVQNYQIAVMTEKHATSNATLAVLDASGALVGVSDPTHHVVFIGNVPADAIYTVVVVSHSKRPESCVLYCTGAIAG